MLCKQIRYTRNTIWVAHNGKETPVRELGSLHLASVIHLKRRQGNSVEFLEMLESEARYRRIPEEFLAGGPYPFTGAGGQLLIWDYGFGYPVKCYSTHPLALSEYQKASPDRVACVKITGEYEVEE
jgi:hypothetical protein